MHGKTCAQHVAKHVMCCYVCVVPKRFYRNVFIATKKIAYRHFKPKNFLLITENSFSSIQQCSGYSLINNTATLRYIGSIGK